MSKNRDNEPGYIFCSAETKAKLDELDKRSGADTTPDNACVIADIIPYGFCVVVAKADFLGWLFDRDSDHYVWTVPEESEW